MPDGKRYSLVKPDLNTPFHIDFEWWQEHDNNWRVYLQNCLCVDHQAAYINDDKNIWLDWVDPQTAEIKPIDGIQHLLITHCAKQPGFITNNTALVDSVFRTLLANGNNPLTVIEISNKIGKSADIILRTLASGTIYRGIKPCPK
jgi:hypothetical protein